MATHFLYDWGGYNVALFRLINGIKDPSLDVAMLLATFLGDVGRMYVYGPVFAAIAIIAAARHFKRQELSDGCVWLVALFTLFGAFVADGLFLTWIKPMLDMPRPALALGLKTVKVLGEVRLHHSFPSGHASFAMLLATSLWLVLPALGRILAVAFVAWVAIARVYVGAHFPADVVAGMLSSLIITLIVLGICVKVVPEGVRIIAGWRARAARLK